MKNNLPTISICMATLNAEAVLEECFRRVFNQEYPKEKLELIVGDGGSIDETKNIVKKYGGAVFHNSLKTAESGKAVAVKQAKNDLILILDSDNYLPETDWLKKMVQPFQENDILLSEPIRYTWRKEGGYIERYSALIGMNDPVCLFLGNYDRWNYVTHRWTDVPHTEEKREGYSKITLDKRGVPTVGANGTIFRRLFLQSANAEKYLFDIDVIAKEIARSGYVTIAKVDIGIIHTFCESDFWKFVRKQQRRIKDYIFHKKNGSRTFNWEEFEFGGKSSFGLARFVLYTVLVIPLAVQAVRGYMRKPDKAWFFHVPACWVTLIVYAWGKFIGIFYQEEMSREGWRQ